MLTGRFGHVSTSWAERPLPAAGLRSPPLSPAQAFVISFTSDFIPRLVYLYMYSKDGTMHGFVNHTLSSFDVSDFQNGTAPNDPLDLGYEVQICRYCSRQLALRSRVGWAAGESLAGAGILSGPGHGTAQSWGEGRRGLRSSGQLQAELGPGGTAGPSGALPPDVAFLYAGIVSWQAEGPPAAVALQPLCPAAPVGRTSP